MMGTSLQVLMRLQTSSPSRSGSPRSSTITSGAWTAAWMIPSSPVSAVRTVWLKACSPTMHTASKPGSSSMMRSRGNLLLLAYQSGPPGRPRFCRHGKGSPRLVGDRCCHGQREAEPRAAVRDVFDPDTLPVGLDERLGDGEAQPGARVAGPPREQSEDLVAAFGAHAGTVVSYVHRDRLRVREDAADRDRAVLRAVPDGVLQQVGEHPGNQRQVDVDRREVVGKCYPNGVPARL